MVEEKGISEKENHFVIKWKKNLPEYKELAKQINPGSVTASSDPELECPKDASKVSNDL